MGNRFSLCSTQVLEKQQVGSSQEMPGQSPCGAGETNESSAGQNVSKAVELVKTYMEGQKARDTEACLRVCSPTFVIEFIGGDDDGKGKAGDKDKGKGKDKERNH